MVKRKENFLVLGMLCLIIAFIINMAAITNIYVTIVILSFIGISIYANAKYIVLNSLEKKKK